MMNVARRTLCTFGWIPAVTVAAVLAGCGGPAPGPEEALRAWVDKGVSAAENKRRAELMGMVAASYADSRGNAREDIDKLLRLYFMRQNRIALLPSIQALTIYDDSAALIDLTVGMAGTGGGTFGFSADAYRFVLEVGKDGDDWELLSARWGELGEEPR